MGNSSARCSYAFWAFRHTALPLLFASVAAQGANDCSTCAGYSCDEWIKWDPSFTCGTLEERWGCDCSGCKSCSNSSVSSSARLVLLDEARFPGARCLDGSMSGYYLRGGASDKYLIFFEGGGWCYDQHCKRPTRTGTLKDCRSRAKGRLGSSKRWPASKDAYFTGMLSADKEQNPVFHDWTLIYLPYCDGTSWTGDAIVDGLYFKGGEILNAIVADVIATTSIRRASQVVVSGGSAGASAVFFHIDTLAKRLALEHGEVMGLPDAGFFLNLKDKDGIDCWPSQMRSLFDVSGYDSLHQGCLARYPQEKWRCMFPEYYADLISTRLLSIMSLYDSSELWSTLRLNCTAAGSRKYPKCKGQQEADFQRFRKEHMDAWAPLLQKEGNGVWSPACISHTLTWRYWTDRTWEVPADSGNTMAAVVQKWLSPSGRHQVFDYQDAVSWPGNAPCSGIDKKASSTVV